MRRQGWFSLEALGENLASASHLPSGGDRYSLASLGLETHHSRACLHCPWRFPRVSTNKHTKSYCIKDPPTPV